MLVIVLNETQASRGETTATPAGCSTGRSALVPEDVARQRPEARARAGPGSRSAARSRRSNRSIRKPVKPCVPTIGARNWAGSAQSAIQTAIARSHGSPGCFSFAGITTGANRRTSTSAEHRQREPREQIAGRLRQHDPERSPAAAHVVDHVAEVGHVGVEPRVGRASYAGAATTSPTARSAGAASRRILRHSSTDMSRQQERGRWSRRPPRVVQSLRWTSRGS